MAKTQRVVISLDEREWAALQKLSSAFGWAPSQTTKYVLLGELKLPRKEPEPRERLVKELKEYVLNLEPKTTFYVYSAFPQDRWWDFDTGTKRTLAWTVKALEKEGICEKTEKILSNGTHQYKRR